MTFDNYNGQNQKSDYHPRTYSPYRFNNSDSKVDQTCLAFSYWNHTLCMKIAPKKQTGNPNVVQFDMEAAISIYLSHSKARMFQRILKLFKEDRATYSGYGIPAGKGLLSISNGSEYGTDNPCIVARTVDENTGVCTAEYVYELKDNTSYYYGISGYDPSNGKYDKTIEPFVGLEFEMIECIIDQYIKAATMATAASVIEGNNYEMSRLNGKIESIGAKLGVEFGNRSNTGAKFKNQSYFANSEPGNASSFTPGSLAELDDSDDTPY